MHALYSPKIKSLILDMDGVLWKGDSPIGDLPAIIASIRDQGIKFIFATNNGTRTPGQYVERLAGFGVAIDEWQVVTSSQAVADLLAARFAVSEDRPGVKVFAIGELGLLEALKEKNFEILSLSDADQAKAVIIGIDRQINFEKMCAATLLVRQGLPFYATNPDKTFPTPLGEIPGAGAWASVVITASGVDPIYAGKPSPVLLELARKRLGTLAEETLVVGDRLETDIAGGQAAGMPVALVLSGVSTQESMHGWNPKIDIVASDLSQLVGL